MDELRPGEPEHRHTEPLRHEAILLLLRGATLLETPPVLCRMTMLNRGRLWT